MTISRAPKLGDLPAVLELMRAHDAAAWGDSDWTEQDLRELWAELDLERDAWIVEVDGRPAGYVDFEKRRGGRMIADGYVHPQYRGRGVGTALAEMAERRAAGEAERRTGRAYLQYGALLADAGTAAFFERRGYRDVRHQWRMLAELDASPSVQLPDGIVIEPYRSGEERTIHAALEEAWAAGAWLHTPRSYEEYAASTFARPGHDPSLYWVARDGDQIAGAILCDWKRNGDWGWVGTLGVRPAWRRRGIGEALLEVSFAEFFRRGENRVALQVDAQSSTGAPRLYERVGMRVLYEVAVYEKELRAA
ncbi:MAG: GNAT family N-acetyltransferase [Actinomycetota bacterium]|nr:GNAT family N-acetyltransferase [Actinomycetota bacterium]